MDKNVTALMSYLVSKDSASLQELEVQFSATTRQITYRLEKLNQTLKSHKSDPIEISSSKEICIKNTTRKSMVHLLTQKSEKDFYYYSKNERHIYIYLVLFLNLNYLSLNHFVDFLKVSRSTVLSDMKELIPLLEEEKVSIQNTRSNGYYLVGDEADIRRIMMKYMNQLLNIDQNGKLLSLFIKDFRLDVFDTSYLMISDLSKKYNIRFVEDRLVEFIYILILLKARIQNGKHLEGDKNALLSENVSDLKEYKFARELIENLMPDDKIDELDLQYIVYWILGISFGNIYEDTRDCVLISDLVGKIMTRFEMLSGAHYRNTEEIFIRLYSHFRPAYYRLLCHLPIYNPLCDVVKKEYKELYQLVQETMRPYNVLFGGEIPDEELSYLAMHFSVIYTSEKKIKFEKSQKTALIVCSNGIGSSSILYNELTEMFPELHFLTPISFSHLDKFKEEADIIFTTNYIIQHIEANVPVIQVQPVMNLSQRYNVLREVYMQLNLAPIQAPNINRMMQIISKYATIHQPKVLYDELIVLFSQSKIEKRSLTLSSMISKYLICLHLRAASWQEALRLAYQPMVDYGYITQNYVEDTIRSVEISGPYIVIAPHVALPHSMAKNGALKTGLGISVLETPVKFGNKSNDPVKYIFSLSALDNESHIGAMAQLIELLNDSTFFQMLDTAKNEEELHEYIRNMEKKIKKATQI